MAEQHPPQTSDQVAANYHKGLDARFDVMAEDIIKEYQGSLGRKPDTEQVIADYNRRLGVRTQYGLPEDTPAMLVDGIDNYPNQMVMQYISNRAAGNVVMLHLYFERQCLVDAIADLDDGQGKVKAQQNYDELNRIILDEEQKRGIE